MKSLSDCTRVFSSGRWHSSTSAEAPRKPKFQPSPSRISDHQKCATSTPASPMAADSPVSTNPAVAMRKAPKRTMRLPVKKLGAYMAMTCHCKPRLADCCECPHRCMARGAAVIRKFISMYDTAPQTTAATKRGWRAISANGRPLAISAAPGMGRRTPSRISADAAATAACTRKVAANM
ncbi:Uncharacterised protein [Bordetella pertussis]|nr:Uncharacterised protein [Bordetella pertussis]CPP35462.1 Uncharacterised protein [Bordetella pertussis]SUV87503.1 Uncharacterised protein [Bordetella pertussis]